MPLNGLNESTSFVIPIVNTWSSTPSSLAWAVDVLLPHRAAVTMSPAIPAPAAALVVRFLVRVIDVSLWPICTG